MARFSIPGSTTSSAIFNPSNQTWTTQRGHNELQRNPDYGTSVLLPLTPANSYKPKIIIMGGGSPATNYHRADRLVRGKSEVGLWAKHVPAAH